MGTQHDHWQANQPSRKRLAVALGLGLSVVVVQRAGALASGSMSLLADAGHMLTDMGGVLLAWSP